MNKAEYLRRRPDTTGPFKFMDDWARVPDSELDQEAFKLYSRGATAYTDLPGVAQRGSKSEFLAFLRYDYKKILIRTRFLYVDRPLKPEQRNANDDIDLAYFEPVLLCFPCLEFVGRLAFSDNIQWSYKKKDFQTYRVLKDMLQAMERGYQEHAHNLVDFHRNAVSHELRPDDIWSYTLKTETEYQPPTQANNGALLLDIPHFIDSTLMEIEKLCDRLTGTGADEVITKLRLYVSKRF